MRLYESCWVEIDSQDMPAQVRRDRINPAAFNVGAFQYDIDGRPMRTSPDAPRLVRVLSIQAAREAGLRQDYNENRLYGT